MANHPQYPFLEMLYDEHHRGKILEERTQVLPTDGDEPLATVGYLWRNVLTVHGNPRGAKNWELIHQGYVNAWDARAGNIVHGGALHREGGYARYLDSLKENTRLKLKVAMVGHQIEDLPSDPEVVFDEYDEMTRKGTQPERGPLQDYIGQQVGRFANESLDALSVPIGDPEEASHLRAFVQRFHRGCRNIAFKLNCMASRDPHEHGAPSSSGTRAASTSRSSGGRGQRGRGITIGTPRRRGPEVAVPPEVETEEQDEEEDADEETKEEDEEDADDSDDSEEADPTYGQEEIGISQLPDAPSPTQASPPTKRQVRARDRAYVLSANKLPTNPGRPRRQKKPFTPNPSGRR
ncbi:hypothetical protein HU200_041114 [Digitaria exilis]|uniref:Uncharacterized protein n=1 Tax=Digitaria exilis TaxID=1010633 RepID=A0A835BDK1_9POAL|nr:hypothetical protein HU200_041114 [Digitaria exilis]